LLMLPVLFWLAETGANFSTSPSIPHSNTISMKITNGPIR
jgi:hypothetical protein